MENSLTNIVQKYKALSKNQKVFVIIGIVFILGLFMQVTGIGKPSVCDCNKAAMDYVYKDKGAGKWTECAQAYEAEIRAYGKRNGQEYVNIYDEGIGYFAENCNK